MSHSLGPFTSSKEKIEMTDELLHSAIDIDQASLVAIELLGDTRGSDGSFVKKLNELELMVRRNADTLKRARRLLRDGGFFRVEVEDSSMSSARRPKGKSGDIINKRVLKPRRQRRGPRTNRLRS